MSFYDIIMLIVLGGAVFFGWWKGFSWQVASFASIILSYFVACNFHGMVTPLLDIGSPQDKFVAMLILFLGTSAVVWITFGYIKNSIEKLRLKGFDHQVGALLGAIKGAVLCMLITLFSVTLIPDSVIQSRSGNFIARSINQIFMIVPDEIHAYLEPRLNKLNEEMAKAGHDPTEKINFENRDGWFVEGSAVPNTQPNNNGQGFEGQFSLPSTNQEGQGNGWPNINVQVNSKDLIDRGLDQLGRGINGNQNR